ncbi:cardiolipin synthase [Listeria monocytogenes]|mgnify:CR=1 FL=1|jgi:cardiolipin synthetase 2 (EC 2.7.8.-)|uniref:Cardiolipin synthase n=10 Tax=Listeria monocytogenes TaxID=1639 RepID=CLS_LISMO|nr:MULTISPECIES: cardiolipin synthase [Listeria]NP_466026.1 cardiolipin synthase [Listeria monocytogenes EGD-e]C1KYS0.1 RecName: Full=Cardiolipin synthase; Short=CL synthase [Listeria monocytogenes serotype 4b str. CLIP 80459]Q71WS5.1 RecName: Full=Cardiolipin synthase; Short=CL synthase [Listeria monocytogenes serotype 4b str. F2365]Q8Y4E3.1 RecName: Full=Cardiolipin synthase; Short=CL synthase [Listeria monocytogenes EGD-e]EAA0166509.1 cardiolipin synthase [Listeria monocytogenes serotype 1/
MGLLAYLLVILLILNVFFAAVTVFLERRDTSATWAWLLVLTFVPIFGFIIYLIFGRKLSGKKIFDWKGQEKIGIQESTANQIEMIRQKEFPFSDPNVKKHRDLIYLLLVNDGAILTQDNEVELFVDGHEKFDALIADIEKAKDHIHLIYYIFHSDELGNRLMRVLERKAAEGLNVKIIYDAMGSRTTKKSFFRTFQKNGGLVRPFFPSKLPLINFRLNYRNHRKLAIIDGDVGYIGGFNIGDEYLGASKKFGYWRDTHLRVHGKAVYAMQTRFIMDWNSASSTHKIDYKARYFPTFHGKGHTSMQIVSSGPDSEWQQIKNGYIKMINAAKKTIYLQSPYFIPDASLLEAIKIAALSGVDVRVMIPNKPDHAFVYRATTNYAGELMETGAKIFIYDNGFIHAKTLVVDGEIASVGTANMDFRSFRLNFEVNAFIYEKQMVQKLEDAFLEDILKSYQLTPELYAKRSLWIKFKEAVSRLLSPIL